MGLPSDSPSKQPQDDNLQKRRMGDGHASELGTLPVDGICYVFEPVAWLRIPEKTEMPAYFLAGSIGRE